METPPQKKSEVEQVGGVFGITVVVLLIALGGIYFLITQHQKNMEAQKQLQEQASS